MPVQPRRHDTHTDAKLDDLLPLVPPGDCQHCSQSTGVQGDYIFIGIKTSAVVGTIFSCRHVDINLFISNLGSSKTCFNKTMKYFDSS